MTPEELRQAVASGTIRPGGTAEIAAALSVSRQTVSNWFTRHSDKPGFPEPLFTLAAGPVYDIDEIVRWKAGYIPQSGNPSLRRRVHPGQRLAVRNFRSDT